MKLERLDISGFKSFGDKVELTFHEGVTAIVGPNGCGKSNIADSIGWVLGEQSAKSLRGQKMEDVIFNGSQARPPLSLAEVHLHISNLQFPSAEEGESPEAPEGKEPRKRPQPERSARGEVVVTRRLDRAGNSEYLVDGVVSRLRDIQELFMGTGVGGPAYAIIEQGKIGLILSSKPTDRRALIEEAAGITKYKSRRRAAELKLQAAQQNLFRVNDIVYEITRQMNSLKRQAGKARRYRRLSQALNRLERVVAVKKAGVLDARLSEIRARLSAVADEELRRATSLATAENFLERSRLLEAEKERELADIREALHQLELAIERLDQGIERDRRQIVELSERRAELAVEARELEARLGPVASRLEEREKEEVELARELESREAETGLHQGRLREASTSLLSLESSIEDRRGEIVHRISKVAALNNFLQGVLANAEKVSAELFKLEAEVSEVEVEKSRLERAVLEARRELEGEREKRDRLSLEREALEAELGKKRSKLQEMDLELSRGKDELSGLQGRWSSLEELVARRAHFGAGVRLLLNKGRERGISLLGSVADAIDVEPGLERAAEAFLDSALQRVRVENETDVGRALELLGSEPETGRSELLVESLSKTPGEDLRPVLRELEARGLEGLVGLLSEKLRYTEDPLAAGLPDAIVVATLDQAIRGYQEIPASYVSLSGEVVAPPGVVALGPGGASAGLLLTRREIRELEEEVLAAKGRFESCAERRRNLQEELASGESESASLRDELHALEKNLVALEHRSRQLDEDLARVARKREVLESERGRALSERTILGGKRAEMEAALESEERAKADAETALESLRGEISSRRAAVESLQAKAAEERSRLAALRERKDALHLDVERLREGVAELARRLDASKREEVGLGERESGLKQGMERARKELESAIAARSEKVEAGRSLEARVSALKRGIETTESALKIRRRELETVRERRSAEEVALAREESDREHLRASFEEAHGISLAQAASLVSPQELARGDEETQADYAEIKEKIDAIGPVNPMADEEYRDLQTRHDFVTRQRQDLLDSIAQTETAIGRIDRNSRQRFKEAFEAVNREFQHTFRQLFGGGGAGLRLVDEEDLLESGIDIIAQPPGKKLQNVLLLSGGEKAMTAIALLFAIFRYRPSPFCLLDEVDAPLDDANIGRFLTMLRELRDTTQFIIITHSRKTMEMADQLYGVTMEEPGISKLVSVSLVEHREPAVEAVAG
jgi:chromosome segregation protein